MHDADWDNCSELGLSSACRPHCSAVLQNAAEREVRSEICGQWGSPHIRLWSGGDTGWWGVSPLIIFILAFEIMLIIFSSISIPACSTKIELLPKVDHLNNIRTHRCTADTRKAPKTVPRYLVQKMEISGADCKNYSRLEVSDDAYLKTCKYLHVGEGTSQYAAI